MDQDNVVIFPGQKRDAPPQTLEDIHRKVTENRISHSASLAEALTLNAIGNLVENGITLTEKEETNLAMLLGVIESIVARSYGLDNKFSNIADEIFDSNAVAEALLRLQTTLEME